jgi:hypothetical protein
MESQLTRRDGHSGDETLIFVQAAWRRRRLATPARRFADA